MSKVSLKMIAKSLGVSDATVSLVLSGKGKNGRVGKELSEKIIKKAQELNYRPNILARSLRLGRSQTIGLVLADISNPFFANLAFHIQEYAEKFNYTVFITNTNENTDKMETAIEILKSRQVDGMIIVPTEKGSKCIENLLSSSTPIVLLDRCYPDIKTNVVMIDNYLAAYEATSRMINVDGCKKVGFMTYENSLFHFAERTRGFVDAMKKADIYDERLIKHVNYQTLKEDTQKAINELTTEGVDSVFFATDSICIKTLKYLTKNDLVTYDKLKVTSFDYNEIFDFIEKPLSYIVQPLQELGTTAAEMLIGLINNEEEETNKEMKNTLLSTQMHFSNTK